MFTVTTAGAAFTDIVKFISIKIPLVVPPILSGKRFYLEQNPIKISL